MRRNFMLDSETCGTIGNAILQVSVVEFSFTDPIDVEYPIICDIHFRAPQEPDEECGNYSDQSGWDSDTLKFWKSQPHYGPYMERNRALSHEHRAISFVRLNRVFDDLKGEDYVLWVKNVWFDIGCIDFDCSNMIDRHFISGFGDFQGAIHHRATRDIYTALDERGIDPKRYRVLERDYNTQSHDALHDAIAQAKAFKHVVQGLP